MMFVPAMCISLLSPAPVPESVSSLVSTRLNDGATPLAAPNVLQSSIFPESAWSPPSMVLAKRFAPEDVEVKNLTPEEEADAKSKGRILLGLIVCNSVFWRTTARELGCSEMPRSYSLAHHSLSTDWARLPPLAEYLRPLLKGEETFLGKLKGD